MPFRGSISSDSSPVRDPDHPGASTGVRTPGVGAPGVAHVALDGISKRFGGAQALESVSLSIAAGQVHALVGENGAGKSTLGRVIAGLIAPDGGTLAVEGEKVTQFSPRYALRRGITMVAQELVLLPAHNVVDNVFLGIEATRAGFLSSSAQRRRFEDLNRRTGFDLDPSAPVSSLSIAEQQIVEIMRALARDARLIVMDEPTAALSRDETTKLLGLIRGLRDGGTTIVLVSHHLEEVLAVADTVTVLKNGQMVRSAPATNETSESLVTAMLGMKLDLAFPSKVMHPPEAPSMLSVSELRFTGGDRPVSLEIRAGEIVGIAGLVGSGRTKLARAIFGADKAASGDVRVAGKRLKRRSPKASIEAGMMMLPEDRRDLGLLMGRSVQENVTIANLGQLCLGPVVRSGAERGAVDGLIGDLDIRPAASETPVRLLSGGNQQKVMLAKACFCEPKVLIVDEPTRGVDVGAKQSIYRLIVEMAQNGLAVLVISSEFEEVIGLAHRVLVMRTGRMVGEFARDADEETLMKAAVIGR